MKRLFVLLVGVMLMFGQELFAQPIDGSKLKGEEAKNRREELMQTRLELLKTELKLTDAQLAKFDPIYRKYRGEMHKVTSMNKEARTKKELITNENALKVLSARLSNNILTSTVKQRYLFIFAEVIEPLQVMQLYKVDEKISREAHKIMKYRQTAATLDAGKK
jgi:hypothetical protein